MIRNRESALKELQEVAFRMYDIALFLDTHPSDDCALAEYKSALNKYNSMAANFEKLYGPLKMSSIEDCDTEWKWIKGPWPWEPSKNEGVCK